MTNAQLAEEIRKNFTPLVFTCKCGGADENCRTTLDENIGGVWQIYDTVRRITDFIENHN